ncbi:hypothetical protein ACLD43_15485 [Clostridium botulinum]|uniref:hypothetical protein n=1 Tax=Clostridium botulinum TaxID=1491 RepID=UPI003A7FD74D
MPKVITYKKLKNETETIMSYGDVLNIIEENLGSDIANALLDFQIEEAKEEEINIISYIEDGIFTEQIRESGLIENLVSRIINDLEEQGYLKKSKSMKKFIPDEEELLELIDVKLSPGMMNYFEK